MENLFWAIMCIIAICGIYTVVGVCIYTVLYGMNIDDAFFETIKEFKFWEQ